MNIYEEYGYESREDYLKNLSYDNNVDFYVVKELAEVLGENEDFDGLVSLIEDF